MTAGKPRDVTVWFRFSHAPAMTIEGGASIGKGMCRDGKRWVALACTLSLWVSGAAVVAEDCVQGVGCSQCPAGHYTRASNGSLLCCPSCAAAVLYHGDIPSSWCVCYADTETQSSPGPRMIRFPGPARLLNGGSADLGSSPSFQDAFFIINHGPGGLGHVNNGRGGVSPAVQQALTLLADTLENLNARVIRLEEIVARTQELQHSGTLNRVGTAAPPTSIPATPPIDKPCPTNYSRIDDNCYYVSMWHDYRAMWQDARTACEGLSGKLAEPVTRGEFLGLTRQLSSISATSVFLQQCTAEMNMTRARTRKKAIRIN
ncbi:hypothetical protein E2C01_018941 [Portunus trituberculatus]|uniref:C-type lectin domain-containing protein n=1 Tax=Portunus trituberculatus TaxID=210409 RepID=A0A5B7DWM3_PORTR|nr:hypothetical protein [Portunus trituberculatus]